MIVYNVTVSIDPAIKDEWLQWMRAKHIPDVMATGCFKESRLTQIHPQEPGETTFAIGYVAYSQDKLDEYSEVHAPKLQQEHSAKYDGKFAAFRTLMTIIEEF